MHEFDLKIILIKIVNFPRRAHTPLFSGPTVFQPPTAFQTHLLTLSSQEKALLLQLSPILSVHLPLLAERTLEYPYLRKGGVVSDTAFQPRILGHSYSLPCLILIQPCSSLPQKESRFYLPHL